MAVSDFKVEVRQNEVVVTRIGQGHTYRFPIIAGTTVSFRAVIEPNPRAKRAADRFLLEAYNAARAALD
jgi:hypothetical protein